MLGRNSEWRQGSFLTDEAAVALGLVASLGADRRAVVISHDCDLANDAEPSVELIVGSTKSVVDPMMTAAKHPRKLHLRLETSSGADLCIEIEHCARTAVDRQRFSSMAGDPDSTITLPPDEKRAMKQWLAARYGRPAFPNAFEERLRKPLGVKVAGIKNSDKKSVDYLIGKLVEPAAAHVVALLFDLDDCRDRELEDGSPYPLQISIVYDAEQGADQARIASENVAMSLKGLFETTYGTPDNATEIALEACTAVADTAVTLAALRRVDQWRLEYISLREEPAGEFLAVGEMPA